MSSLQLRLPFNHGAPAPLFAGRPRTTLDSGLIRVELDNGLVGWGESYGAELDALSAIFRSRVVPLATGRDAADPALMASLERTLHNMGRSGPVLHALSGLDIAIWDLKAKIAGVPLHVLLGGHQGWPPKHRAGEVHSRELLQMVHSVRSERQLVEQIQHNLLLRWFGGLAIRRHRMEPFVSHLYAGVEQLGDDVVLSVR